MLSLLDLTLAVVPTLKFDFYNRMVTGLLEVSSMFRAFKRLDRQDQILHGTKVCGLLVEFPIKFELTVNFKTARVLDLEPTSILLRADEVIE